jgi:ankyrin repeat protein
MWAVRSNSLAAAKLLVEHGASIDAATRVGNTPPWVSPNAGGGSHGLGINKLGIDQTRHGDSTGLLDV